MSTNSKNMKRFNKGSKKNKKFNRNTSSNREEMKDSQCTTSYKTSSNPIEWYNKYPYLMEAASRIPFPYRPGTSVPFGTSTNSTDTKQLEFTVPGVCVVNYIPAIGFGYNNNSPISQTAKELYARVRSAFSANLDVDAPDLMMYLLSLDSIFSNIAYLKRIFRLVNSFSEFNYARPELLLNAMGFSNSEIGDLRKNLMQGWNYINSLVLMSRRFVCPAIFDLFNRHYWMNDNVFKDADSLSAQYYLFNPELYYVFEEAPDATTPSRLVPTNYPSNKSWDLLYTAVFRQIESLSESADAYKISGYLMRTFEGQKAFVVEEIQYSDRLEPVYDPVVLMQIENSQGVGPIANFNADSLYINQNPETNAIQYTPVLTTRTIADGVNALIPLNIRSEAPTAADVVEASRLKAYAGHVQETVGDKYQFTGYPVHCGSEIVTRYLLMTYNATTSNVVQYAFNSIQSTELTAAVAQIWCALEQFDWHPTHVVITGTNRNLYPFMEAYNITTLTNDAMDEINRICLYSEFNSFGILR